MTDALDVEPTAADLQARTWVLGFLATGTAVAVAATVRAAVLQRCDGEGGGAAATLLGLVANVVGAAFLLGAPVLVVVLVALRVRGRWTGTWWPGPLAVIVGSGAVFAVFGVLAGLCSGWDL